MEDSLFNPMRCIDDESELDAPGRLYMQNVKPTQLDPVILLPGIGGSSLDAQLAKDSHHPSWYCFQTYNWFRIWFDIEELVAQKCWMDNLAVTFNPTTGDYNNTAGVSIRPTDFGGTKGVEYLDYKLGIPISLTSIYAPMVKSLVAVGYVRGKNVRGAPFDWRLPSAYMDKKGWYKDFQLLVEDTYTINGNKPVHLVAHSLGCPTALYFLNKMPQAWLDKYVKSFIPIAGPWSGAGKSLRAAISGDNFGLSFAGIDIVSKHSMRDIARYAGGLVQLFPDDILWSDSAVWVRTPQKNYTVKDYATLFADMGAPMTTAVWKSVNTLNQLKPPNVPTSCIYGTGTPTEVSYFYNKGFDTDPQMTMGDGDGTVPVDSLRECAKWDAMQGPPVNITSYKLINHGDIIKDPNVIAEVLSLVAR